MIIMLIQAIAQCLKPVYSAYSALLVVSLAMALPNSVVAQSIAEQGKTVLRQVETVVMQSGQREAVTSQGIIIRIDGSHKPMDAPLSIEVEEITYDSLPAEVAAMLDPSFSREEEGVWQALPLRLYRIRVLDNSATIFPVWRVYLPTKGILLSDSVFSAYFLRTEYLPPSIMMCATSAGLIPCERLSLWQLAGRYVEKTEELPADIIRYNADNYVGIFDQTPPF